MWSATGWRRPMPLRPVRTPACPDGRLGALPGPGVGRGSGGLGVVRPKSIGGVNQVKQGNFSQRGPGSEPHPKAHGRQGRVDWNDLAPGLHCWLPEGITVVRATSLQGGKACPDPCPPLPSPARESPTPQRRGLRPLRKRRCAYQDHVTLRCHPPLLKGNYMRKSRGKS